MSSTTWTPRAVASRAAPETLALWRAVEAQHVVSTMPLVGSLEEQRVLEEIIEETKPRLPPGAQGLDYLLATPFRYPPPPGGSRFRGAAAPGVFYGADERRTACAELGYWRWRFLLDTAALDSIAPAPQTLFRARAQGACVDLRAKPFQRDRTRWTHPSDYSGTQAFADTCRDAGVALIRYESVRDPHKGGCAAVLEPQALAGTRRPIESQTWYLHVARRGVAWKREGESFEFAWATPRGTSGSKA